MTKRFVIVLALASLSLGAGCVGQPSKDPPVVPIRNMYQQARYNPQAKSDFFQDGRTMRPPVEGAIAREMEADITVATGRSEDNSEWLLTVPDAVVQRHNGMGGLVARGQQRFNVYCTPCHAQSGDGQSMVARRAERLSLIGQSGSFQPPSLHDPRIRHIPDGQLYATITNGIRTMPAYRHSIPQDDRWAIVAYVRALQLSQASRTTAMNTTEQSQ
ncbi:MAG: cytochrome c [Polyangiales bacterium]